MSRRSTGRSDSSGRLASGRGPWSGDGGRERGQNARKGIVETGSWRASRHGGCDARRGGRRGGGRGSRRGWRVEGERVSESSDGSAGAQEERRPRCGREILAAARRWEGASRAWARIDDSTNVCCTSDEKRPHRPNLRAFAPSQLCTCAPSHFAPSHARASAPACRATAALHLPSAASPISGGQRRGRGAGSGRAAARATRRKARRVERVASAFGRR